MSAHPGAPWGNAEKRVKSKITFAAAVMAGVLAGANSSVAQAVPDQPSLRMSGYAEAYYLKDFNDPSGHTRPGFVYSHNRNDALSINLALLQVDYDTTRFRAGLGVAAGTYMRANYAAEPGALNNLFEANVGLRLSARHDVWVDVGVMPSHIGFESAIGKDNWTLTRSMAADNSPYFETGAKLSYATADGKWFISGLVLNGWQRIEGPAGNSTPSVGHQLTYRSDAGLTLNSSSFIGNDKSDDNRQMRYFHNFYAQFPLSDEWSVTAGLDVGAEQAAQGSSRYDTWFSPILVVRYAPTARWALAARGEYYQDPHGVIVSTGTPNGFRTFGASINADYAILPGVLLRTEVRRFEGHDRIFSSGRDSFTADSLIAVTALCISF